MLWHFARSWWVIVAAKDHVTLCVTSECWPVRVFALRGEGRMVWGGWGGGGGTRGTTVRLLFCRRTSVPILKKNVYPDCSRLDIACAVKRSLRQKQRRFFISPGRPFWTPTVAYLSVSGPGSQTPGRGSNRPLITKVPNGWGLWLWRRSLVEIRWIWVVSYRLTTLCRIKDG